MIERRPIVLVKPWVKSRWAGKKGTVRCWLDGNHALVDLEEPGYKATLKFHRRELREVQNELG